MVGRDRQVWGRVRALDLGRSAHVGVCGAVEGRLTPGRHPIRATARARINQFAEANNTLRWLRFLAIPR